MNVNRNGEERLAPEERQAWVQRFRNSGLSLRQFAEEHGIKPTRLHYWVYEAGGYGRSGGAVVTPRFQELALPAVARGSGWALERQSADGSVTRVAAGVDSAWVGAVMRELRGVC